MSLGHLVGFPLAVDLSTHCSWTCCLVVLGSGQTEKLGYSVVRCERSLVYHTIALRLICCPWPRRRSALVLIEHNQAGGHRPTEGWSLDVILPTEPREPYVCACCFLLLPRGLVFPRNHFIPATQGVALNRLGNVVPHLHQAFAIAVVCAEAEVWSLTLL